MIRILLYLFIGLILIVSSSCQAVISLIPTQTPYPTNTSNPTYTPIPTHTPSPTSTLSPSSTPLPILFEDSEFGSFDSCFPVDSFSGVRRFVDGGQYHILVREANLYGLAICENDIRNFVLEVDATVVDFPQNAVYGYGVIFRASDVENDFYSFMVSGSGGYSLNHMYFGESIVAYPVLSWSNIKEVSRGKTTNHLKIVAVGDQIELNVNNVLVGLVRDVPFRSGPFGFIVMTFGDPSGAPDIHVAFDNLIITEP